MRAYHRVDPLMDERKGHYTPAQFGTFLKVQLLAGRQTKRGTFRSVAALKAILPGAYSRHVDHLIAEGDLDILADGSIYIDGWQEWQEGDLTVRDRMAALRNRRRNQSVTAPVTEPSPHTRPPSSPKPPTPPRVRDGAGVGASGPPPDEDRFGGDEGPVLSWLAHHGCYIVPANGYHRQLVTATEVHGAQAIVTALERLANAGMKHGDTKGYVFGVIDALNAPNRPDLKAVAKSEREAEEERAHRNRLTATQNRLKELRGAS